MKIFDTHTHLNVEEFAGQELEEIKLAQDMAVTKMNIVGFDKPTIEQALVLAEKYPQLYATLGWHPTEAGSYNDAVETYLLDKLKHPKVVALGEIGLDYHWMTASKEVQEAVFRRQINLSKELNLPFVVHTRDALEDTYDIIKSEGLGARGGIMHSYSGTLAMAEKFMDLGMSISFSGVVTFKKALDIQKAAQHLPLEKILVETDAPYLAPVPKRGRLNHPAYTRYVVEKIAELRQLSLEEVAATTYANSLRIFGLEEEHEGKN
ncbi:TatD family hydrolase [Streptococcus massiliensis]|uniref:TatD family hydrolase n=1 Tax=Streptococcus massiliensis TaxID=313439 RepID=A0A380KYS1_9STRE|nr:TatD family hydrolase [Streptococcus massiliensis]SUN77133.1 TatD family hydrolase [Streptococcus massiliensis]